MRHQERCPRRWRHSHTRRLTAAQRATTTRTPSTRRLHQQSPRLEGVACRLVIATKPGFLHRSYATRSIQFFSLSHRHSSRTRLTESAFACYSTDRKHRFSKIVIQLGNGQALDPCCVSGDHLPRPVVEVLHRRRGAKHGAPRNRPAVAHWLPYPGRAPRSPLPRRFGRHCRPTLSRPNGRAHI